MGDECGHLHIGEHIRLQNRQVFGADLEFVYGQGSVFRRQRPAQDHR